MAGVVRRLGPTDCRLLRTVRLRALRDAPYAFGSTFAEEMAREESWWTTSAERLAWFVSIEGDEPTGLIAGVPIDDDSGCRAVISMWVSPDRRGSGTAQALWAALAAWARKDGATALSLRVSEGNDRARRFYAALGFRPTGDREPLRSNPAVSAIELRLALPGARLRFGPSPAGDLHVGHVRVAVLTWILARQLDGTYSVRFENTDQVKELPGSREAMVAELEWLGLLGSLPPRDQTEMTESHRAALERLASAGHTYRDGDAVRFQMPKDDTVEWEDLVRGRVVERNDDLDDPVLVRSSGTPTFYLASTVDDGDDGITHLVRSEPTLRLTAKQIHLWRSLGTDPPQVGHVPLVTAPGGRPVRSGATELTVRALRERGISPTALLLYLALPETASWRAPPAGLDEIVDRIKLRHLPRRPTTFEIRALETLNRRLVRLSG